MNLITTKKGVKYSPLKTYSMSEGTIIAIYQGSRGENPELDFIVRYREVGKNKRLRQPSHTHWITDLLVKCEHNKELVGEFVKKILYLYDKTKPFSSKEERDNYELKFYKNELSEFKALNESGYYKMDVLVGLIELFTFCEQQTKKAFMFKKLLNMMIDYCEGRKDFYQIVSQSKRV